MPMIQLIFINNIQGKSRIYPYKDEKDEKSGGGRGPDDDACDSEHFLLPKIFLV